MARLFNRECCLGLYLLGTVLIAVSGGRPHLSILLKDGKFSGLYDGLEPSISWGGASKLRDVDLEYGVEIEARAVTSDVRSIPIKSLWGKARSRPWRSGWVTSARADTKRGKLDQANLELKLSSIEKDAVVTLFASAGKRDGFRLSRVEATKGFNYSNGSRITVNPRYNVDRDDGDIVIGYAVEDIQVELTASQENPSVKVSQRIDEFNRITPTINRYGDIAVEWEHKFGDDSTVTTTVKPNDAIDIKWRENAWTADIHFPIEGATVGAASVSFKRKVTF
jgi:hypothetical protein